MLIDHPDQDEYWLQQALVQAKLALAQDEVPVGAVLVKDNQLIAAGFNRPIHSCDPTAHAEVVTVRNAAQQLNNYRLVGTTLYVTLEPCVLCVGALIQARIARLVFGAYDPKGGAICSTMDVLATPQINHRFEWRGGVLADECAKLLQDFFKIKRVKVV